MASHMKRPGLGGQSRPPRRSAGQASEAAKRSFCKGKLPQKEAPAAKGFHGQMSGEIDVQLQGALQQMQMPARPSVSPASLTH